MSQTKIEFEVPGLSVKIQSLGEGALQIAISDQDAVVSTCLGPKELGRWASLLSAASKLSSAL